MIKNLLWQDILTTYRGSSTWLAKFVRFTSEAHSLFYLFSDYDYELNQITTKIFRY